MDRVFESFDKSSVIIKQHSSWFDYKGENLQRSLDHFDSGFLKVMKKRDSEGRRVVVCNNNIDLDKFNADDIFRTQGLLVNILTMEEETQLSGIVYIMDFKLNNSMKFFSSFPLKSLSDFATQMKFIPIRIKKILIVGLPPYASQFFNIIKMGMSEKMRERMEVIDDISEVLKHIDKSVLTKDFGGDENEKETIEEFRKIIDANLESVQKFIDYDVDLTKASAVCAELENIGSFRKLEID
jgi:hypothetical protein